MPVYKTSCQERIDELDDWIKRNRGNPPTFTMHDNYPAWMEALGELGKQHGIRSYPEHDATRRYASSLVRAGADPEQIKAVFTLLFLT